MTLRGAIAAATAAVAGLAPVGIGASGAAIAGPSRPPQTAAISLEEHTGAELPGDLRFRRPDGTEVAIGEYFDGERPVLLVLAYLRCQMLCSMVLRGVVDGVRELPLAPGEDFHLVTVSIDPDEQASSAAAKQTALVDAIGYTDEPERWSFLRGKEPAIRALADALGFGYAWDERTQQFAHPAVIFVVRGDGVIAEYLHGVTFPTAELTRALRAAEAGEIGGGADSAVAGAVLDCFRFDPALRRHRETIQTFFRAGAALLFLALGALVGGLLLGERRRARRRAGTRGGEP